MKMHKWTQTMSGGETAVEAFMAALEAPVKEFPEMRPRNNVISQARTMGFSAQQGRQYRGIAGVGQSDLAIC